VAEALAQLAPPRVSVSGGGALRLRATPPGGGGDGDARADDAAPARKHAGRALDAVALAAGYAPALEAMLAHTVLQLPRLVAEAAGAFVGARAGAGAGDARLVAAAVGGPLVRALQDTLADADVVALVREAVAVQVQAAIVEAARAARARAGLAEPAS
jgi:hypothetical protein